MKMFVFGFSVFLSKVVYAGDFEKILSIYSSKPVAEVQLEKKVISEILSTEKSYAGTLFLSKGKFRLEMTNPSPSTILFDGKIVWSINGDLKDKANMSVSRFVVPKDSNKGLLLSQLFSSGGMSSALKVVRQAKLNSSATQYTVKVSDPTLSIEELKVTANTKKKRIDEISYHDEVGNLTILKFKNLKLKNSVSPVLFVFQPPKGIKVQEL